MLPVFLAHTDAMFRNYYGTAALAALSRVAEVRRNTTGRHLAGRELAEAARGCAVIVSDRMTPGEAGTFAHAPDLVAFLRCAVDIRTIDVPAASTHGVLVTRATPGFADAVAELGIGMMVDLARGIGRATAHYHRGEMPEPRMGRQLAGATLGILGYGVIGRRLAAIAKALGMTVLVADPHVTPEDPEIGHAPLHEVLAASDFVVCLAVATEETENLLDAAAFAAMKPGALFVNLARGNLVDEAALRHALDHGPLAGAALDVGRAPDQMPTPSLAAHPKVIATPHIGGLTPQAIAHQAFDTVRQVEALAAGRLPPGAVNAAHAYRLGRLGIAL
ncbi:hydroxyacid dehydrogenase [Elioraea sp. Yellowstone]|jgi:D-3-phosphoglycerate dehydrogenase|uniref:NAD(P)-dependent oxidoreductase n=1 Tax=Elioraea sp. Yellowstone TaxID=2592070 RepID=UPI00114F26D3|nr:NAD(P)-dependent oxidoreductase [Elioraea sp. Yellowstone]TQF83682.1 hydroxyacid dehydrogenase [Elioraea sp. Yellowstone]